MESNGILLDADILSHFIAAGEQNLIKKIFAGQYLLLPDQVYLEASRCPWDPGRKRTLDQWILDNRVLLIQFPADVSSPVADEYFRLKAENPRLGKGERACMAIAKYHHDIIASSNFRDIAPYCRLNSITYLGMLDILWIAIQNAIIDETRADRIIDIALMMDNARFPVHCMEAYRPETDLTGWLR